MRPRPIPAITWVVLIVHVSFLLTCDADAGTEKPLEKPGLEDDSEPGPPTRVFRRRGSQGELLNVEYLEKHGYFDMPIQVWPVPAHFPKTCLWD